MKRNSDQILTEWLVLQCQSGNREAAGALARLWYPLLQRYAVNILRNEDDARDAVQDTLLSMNGRIQGLRDAAAFPKWLYRILHRRCVDLIRKQGGRQQRDVEIPEREPLVHDPDYEQNHDLTLALSKLEEHSYQIVHLYYLHGFTVREIAEITGIVEGTVKSRLFTARQTLKDLLGGNDNE